MYLSELMQKEVINIFDGARIGYIEDVEVDICTGKIICFLIGSKRQNINIFCKNKEYYKVFLKEVTKIGEETILVETKTNDCPSNCNKI